MFRGSEGAPLQGTGNQTPFHTAGMARPRLAHPKVVPGGLVRSLGLILEAEEGCGKVCIWPLLQ